MAAHLQTANIGRTPSTCVMVAISYVKPKNLVVGEYKLVRRVRPCGLVTVQIALE